MAAILGLKKSNCKNCYKCIRHCPVKSIKFENNQAHIIQDECILCGKCFEICPQNAKEIRNDVWLCKKAIKEGKKVIASIAPSMSAIYNKNFTSIKKTLQNLGFFDVYETSVAATIVKNEYVKLINTNLHNVIISSCCHTVNSLIQKYYPSLVDCIAPVKTPMQVSGDLIKLEHPDAYVVFIGPCISKKEEIEVCKTQIDVVLTFEEIDNWLNKKDMQFETIEEDKDEYSKTRLFPTSGGILKTMDKSNDNYGYMVVDGIENVINSLEEIKKNNLHKVFIEMSACTGSCINGPAIDKKYKESIKSYLRIKAYAGKKDYNIENKIDTYKNISYLGIHNTVPNEDEIEKILHTMGKFSKDKELNCGSCGYETCREKAIAIYQGKAQPQMCLVYLQEKAQSLSDNIVKLSPNGLLALSKDLKIELANRSVLDIFGVDHLKDVLNHDISDFIETSIFMKVVNTKRTIRNKKINIYQTNKIVELSLFYDESYDIIVGLITDITNKEAEDKNRSDLLNKTIEITDNVMLEQMKAVQEIALLLGETTAESKVALQKLKETLKNGK